MHPRVLSCKPRIFNLDFQVPALFTSKLISRGSQTGMFGYSGQEDEHLSQLEAVPSNRGHGFKLTILCLGFMIFRLGLILLTSGAR